MTTNDGDDLFQSLVDVAIAQSIPLPASNRALYPSLSEARALNPLRRWAREHRGLITDFAKFLTGIQHLHLDQERLVFWVLECEYLKTVARSDGVQIP